MNDSDCKNTWCTAHEIDSDGTASCRTAIEVGDWDATLAINDEATLVWLGHPDIIHVDDATALTPQAAIDLGRALILQGIRGLEAGADVARSDSKSASGRAIASEVRQ